MDYGYIRVAAATPKVRVADCTYNAQEIKRLIAEAESKQVQVICFPELCITGSTCGDLLTQPLLLEKATEALFDIVRHTSDMDLVAIIGTPLLYRDNLFNVAAVIHKGKITGLIPKRHFSDHHAACESRWFTSGAYFNETGCTFENQRYREVTADTSTPPICANQLFTIGRLKFAIEINEDMRAPIPPSAIHCQHGANVIFNLSSHNALVGWHQQLQQHIALQSDRCACGYVYTSSGYGESTTDQVFDGAAFIYENGELLAEGKRFELESQLLISEIDLDVLSHKRLSERLYATNTGNDKPYIETVLSPSPMKEEIIPTRFIDPTPFIPKGALLDQRCGEILNIQTSGLCKRLEHTRCQCAVVGISGGLDSTLALLVCVHAFDKLKRSRKEIIGITMPGFGTTGRTYNNAIALMKSLGVTIREISIKEACLQHFSDIGHNADLHDVTYENSQARERTQILMDVANQMNGLVIGTGDLSELALGWATYNGDHMSMYGVNGGIPKTLVQHLVAWIADNLLDKDSADTLHDIIATPISPELVPADEQGKIKQKTEDLVGPYELHDFFLYHFMKHGFRPRKIYLLATLAFASSYEKEVIKKWLTTFFRRFFNQQFKRSCLPDGPKVGSVSLSPRGDWKMPSDANSTAWLTECEEL